MQKRELVRRSWVTASVVAAGSVLLACEHLHAATYTWQVSSGDWSVASNWGKTNLPFAGVYAYITNGGTASVTQPSATCGALSLGDTGGSGNVQMVTGGVLVAYGSEYVGSSGTGSFTQSGGSNLAFQSLHIGYSTGSSGAYNLSGSGLLNAGAEEYVGNFGTGSFTQSGGTNGAANLVVGNSGAGTYTLSDNGNLSAGTEQVGYWGRGSFQQSGGVNTVSLLYMGYNAGSSGVYTLGGSGRLCFQYYPAYLGYSGSASFIQTGGRNLANIVYLGYNADGSGSYSLTGSGYLSGSVEYVGYNGTGSFFQSGAVNTCIGLSLAGNPGSNGTYSLGDNGLLNTTDNPCEEVIGLGGSASFTQTGGTNNFRHLTIARNSGSSGIYSLSGSGCLLVAGDGNENVGCAGTGSFTQSGGTNVAGYLSLGIGDLTTGTGGYGAYDLSGGGYLSCRSEYIGRSVSGGFGVGNFTQSGGTNSVSSTLYIGSTSGGTSTYNLSGSGYLSCNSERVSGIGGGGAFTQSGGTNVVVGYLYLGSDGNGTYRLSDNGYLSAGTEVLGVQSTGSFTQSGGTNSVGGTLYLGLAYYLGRGVYNLSGSGCLCAGNEEIGYGSSSPGFSYGSGSFTQSGGTNTVSGSICLGHYYGSNGVYNLNGGLLAAGSISGGSGAATFNFNGGTLQAAGNNSTFLSGLTAACVQAGGAIIDVQGFSDTIGQNLLHDSSLGATPDGGLTKFGSGVLRLAGTNTYTGPTTVNQGELAVDGSLFSPVTVNSGGALGGTGSLTSVTVNPGGHLAPGNSPGTLILSGNLALLGGAEMDFQLDTPTTSDMVLMPSGSLALNGQQFADFNFTPLANFAPGIYTLVDAGTISGSLGASTSGTIDGYSAYIARSGNDLVLTVVPEPSTAALVLAGAIGLLGCARRQAAKRVLQARP